MATSNEAEKARHALLIQAGVRLHHFLAVLGGFFFHLGKRLGHFFIIEHVRRISDGGGQFARGGCFSFGLRLLGGQHGVYSFLKRRKQHPHIIIAKTEFQFHRLSPYADVSGSAGHSGNDGRQN